MKNMKNKICVKTLFLNLITLKNQILLITEKGLFVYKEITAVKYEIVHSIPTNYISEVYEVTDPDDENKMSLKVNLTTKLEKLGQTFKARYFKKTESYSESVKSCIERAKEIFIDPISKEETPNEIRIK